jgi:hypothetical protein
MSATMTMTTVQPPNIRTLTSTPSCPHCGSSLAALSVPDPHAALLDAQRKIADLEEQVKLLNEKATAAVDRWADYEDELSSLRAAAAATTPKPVPTSSTPSPFSQPSRFFPAAATSRISALLAPRKSTPDLRGAGLHHASQSTPALPPLPLSGETPAPSHSDLLQALKREQGLRIAAEGKLNDTSREVEELSVTLFEQANEMVATERRARAKLEERVGVLEKRDGEKRGRLERLEGAMARIDRVRELLGDDM